MKKQFTMFVCLHFFAMIVFGGTQLSVPSIPKKQAICIAQSYLQIKSLKEYKTEVKSELITSESYNTYKKLGSEVRRTAWVVTFSVPKAIGASRTVYVDDESGEVLGGYSSK